jgi:Domain of unknown function (DUF6484)
MHQHNVELIVEGAASSDFIGEEFERRPKSAGLVNAEPVSEGGAAWVRSARVIVGKIVGVFERRIPIVDYAMNPVGRPLTARSVVPLGEESINMDVVLAFEDGDPRQPIVLGTLECRREARESAPGEAAAPTIPPLHLQSEGQRLVITAQRELELRCGQASILLTSAGKVLIRGTYVCSRSSGVNRIKGGSVHIN